MSNGYDLLRVFGHVPGIQQRIVYRQGKMFVLADSRTLGLLTPKSLVRPQAPALVLESYAVPHLRLASHSTTPHIAEKSKSRTAGAHILEEINTYR